MCMATRRVVIFTRQIFQIVCSRGGTMSLRQPVPYLLILAAVYLPTLASPQARRSPIWFEGARLIIGDRTPAIESSAFLVEGDSFTWVGKKGDRQPPANAIRVDLTGK